MPADEEDIVNTRRTAAKEKGKGKLPVEGDELDDGISDYAPCDELHSLCNSLDEDDTPNYLEFNEGRDMQRLKLEVGMKYSSATAFRDCLREHCIRNSYDFRFVRNDGDRVTARPIPNDVGIFNRMFVMYDAQKRGMLVSVRLLIGLDACHLKGSSGGQLLSDVVMDGND
ncbi:hypothetical protein L1049_008841 [Liquidambar formosana]|uniref:Transposase MuDR plant domain-containing protein n=1 Tax=Liquidambar formosana TaxID=63359 RepID=A0AAP0S704_LIQFO